MITVNDDKEREKRSILAIVILALVRLVLYISNGSVCGITFYQPKEPDLSELFDKEGFVMKKLMSIAKKASTALAALALVVATTSVPSACFHWFAQPVEPEELRNYVNKK